MRKMKALRTFRASDTNKVVHVGQEFETSLGEQYEKNNYAVFVRDRVSASRQPIENKAAQAGPLGSRGGQTGADNAQSSSPTDQAPRKPRSRKSEDMQESSVSMKDGGSHRSRMSSMDATDRSGESEKE